MSLSSPGARARAEYNPHEFSAHESTTDLANGDITTYLPCVFIPSEEQGYIAAAQEEFSDQSYLLKPGTERSLGAKLERLRRKLRWRRFLRNATKRQIGLFGWLPIGLTFLLLGPIAASIPAGDVFLFFFSYPFMAFIVFVACLPKIQKKYDFGESKLRKRFHDNLLKSGALVGVRKFLHYESGKPYKIGTPSHEKLYEALTHYRELGDLILTREAIPATIEKLDSKFPSERLKNEIETLNRRYDELLQEIRKKEETIEVLLKSKG